MAHPSILAEVVPHTPKVGGRTAARRRALRRASEPPSDKAPHRALEGLTTDTSECAEGFARERGEPCASACVLAAVASFAAAHGVTPTAAPEAETPADPDALPSARSGPAESVRSAAAVLGCSSESCVIAHPSLRQYVVERGLVPPRTLDLELETRFKAPGPRAGKALLSNYNLDETLRRWARVFPGFYPCPFAMMDFDRNGDAFGQLDLLAVLAGREPVELGPGAGRVQRPSTCFGCVVNTDTSRGPGKHWVAVFVDCRPESKPWTVEYFDSVGRPPPRPMTSWMERTRARLADHRGAPAVETLPVTDIDHQDSQTECGLYALFYIRRRLEGAPPQAFARQRIPDAAMTAFRRHVFRAA